MIGRDKQAILSSDTFQYYLPCGAAHPELCAHRNADILPFLQSSSLTVFKKLKDQPCGSFHFLEFGGEGVEPQHVWVCRCWSRGANPRVVTLASAEYDAAHESLRLVSCVAGAQAHLPIYEYLMAVTFLGRVRKSHVFTEIQWCSAPVSRHRVPVSSAQVFLADDWREQVVARAVRIHPPLASPSKAPKDFREAKIAQGLRALKEGLAKAKSAAENVKKGGVRIRLPRARPHRGHDGDGHGGGPADGSDDDGSLASHSDCELSSVGSDSDCAVDLPADGDVPSRRSAQHVKRAVNWGPFSLSQLCMKGGPCVGWGANCHKHHDSGSTLRCTKPFRFVGLSFDECRCLAKTWLLMGVSIPHDDLAGRAQHMGIDRGDIAILPEDELDDLVLGL